MGLFTSKPTPSGDILMTNGRHLSEVPAGFELIPAIDALKNGRIVWGCECKNKMAVVKRGETPVKAASKQDVLKLMMQACMKTSCKGACLHEVYCSLFGGDNAVNIAFAEAVTPVSRMAPYRGGWLHQRGSKRGGDESCHACGGNGALLSELANYTTNDTSEANIRFVNVALAAGKAAGLKIEGSSTKEQIKSFLDSIRNASGNAATCKAIAEAINKEAGEEIISVALEPAAMCQQIAQFVSGWGGAMTGELVNAYVDLSRVIANNRFVINVFEQLIKVLEQHTAGVERVNIKTDIVAAVTAMQEGIKILKQQNGEISNLIATHARPALRTLNDLAKKMTNIGDIKMLSKTGADPLSKWLQNVLHLAGMESASAILVQQALNKIGVDSKEYVEVLRSRRFGDLPHLLLTPTVKAVFSSGDEANVLEALRMITFYSENAEKGEAIAAELEKIEKKGGDAVSPYLPSEETKKVELEHLIKEFIFKAFARRINDELNEFEKQLDDVSKRVGKPDGIPVDPSLDDIADSAAKIQSQLEIIRRSSSYLALTSYHNDAKSRSLKQQVVTDLTYFAKVVDDVISKPFYSKAAKYLVGLRDAARKMIATIEEFSQGVATRQGRTYDAAGGSEEIEVAGGGKGDFSKLITRIYKSPYETGQSINRFKANVKLSTVIDDLKRHGSEMGSFYEKYDSLVANSIANYLVKAREQNDHNIKLIDENLALIEADTNASAVTKLWYKELVTEWKVVNNQQQQAKEAFWATVEAIDLHMKLFTQGIANNPEDVGDVIQMMSNVRLLKDLGSDSFVTDLIKWFGTFTADNDRAFSAVGTPNAADPNATGTGFVGPAQTKKGIEDLANCTENFGTLKNLLSIFARICSNFGGVDAGTKVFMSPGRMYANLVKFLCCASYTNATMKFALYPDSKNDKLITRGIGDGDGLSHMVTADGKLRVSDHIVQYMAMRARNVNDLPTLDEANFRESYPTITGTEKDGEPVRCQVYEMFPREFEYFEMIIKSISAKILVALGLRNVLNRPMNEPGYYKINNIRMILGGGGEIPQINEKAIELYLRLPLLCQFYKNIFGYDGQIKTATPPVTSDLRMDTPDHVKISFVPDIDGAFSGLIRLIFRKINFDDPHAYSNEEIAAIINECNAIYGKLHSKHPENTIKGIIDDLVGEVNRRYGLITEERRKKYEEELGFRYDYYTETSAEQLYDAPTPANIQLLDGEGDEVARLSNAQRLLAARVPKADEKVRENEFISRTHRTILEKFRKLIDNHLVHPEAESYDFKSVVKGTTDRVAREPTPQGKFEAICMMIRSSDELTAGDYVKYMMFHETVVTGLNTLSAIHTFLQRFVNIAWFTSLKGLKAWQQKRGTFAEGTEISSWTLFTLPTGDINSYDSYVIRKNKSKILTMLFNLIFSIGNDFGGLVKVTFSKEHVHLNFGELKDAVSSLMETTAHFINLMRPILGNKGEDYRRLVDPSCPGSLGWLRNHLYEHLILGRDRSFTDSNKRDYISLDKTSELLTATLKLLLSHGDASSTYTSVIFYPHDVTRRPVLLDGYKRVDFTDPLEKLHLVGNPVGGKQLVDMRYLYHTPFSAVPSLQAFTKNRSLLFAFNQAIEKYLKCFFENDKIYVGLLEKFVGGSFAEDIRNIKNTFVDMIPGFFIDNVGNAYPPSNTMGYADYIKYVANLRPFINPSQANNLSPAPRPAPVAAPAPSGFAKFPHGSKQILFMSLAHLIESIMMTKNSTLQTTYSYLIDNVADVPQYTREKMRANLPGFKDIFSTIADNCEMYRQLLTYFPTPITIDDSGYDVHYFDVPGIGNPNQEEATGLLIASLKKIEAGCKDFIDSCESVLKEIGDVPKPLFLEVKQDSIKEFHAKTGQYPFAPLSMLLTILRSESETESGYTNFMPFFGIDMPQFGFAYGTRGLLHAPSSANQAPYMNYLLQTYNAVANASFIADEKDYNKHLNTIINLMRYMYRIKHLCVLTKINDGAGAFAKNLSSIENSGLVAPLVLLANDKTIYSKLSSRSLTSGYPSVSRAGKTPSFTSEFVTKITLPKLMLMAEDGDLEKQARKVLAPLLSLAPKDKFGLIVQNILDLGIIPINIHSMARFIPLAHLMNYSYSFDRLVCELLHGYSYKQSVDAQDPLSAGITDSLYKEQPVRSSLDALRVSLIRPFISIKPEERIFWANMMRGESTVKGLSRGKLLYELYGRVLSGYKPATMNIFGQHEPRKHHMRLTLGSYMGREILGGTYEQKVDEVLRQVMDERAADGKAVPLGDGTLYVPQKAVQSPGTRELPEKYITDPSLHGVQETVESINVIELMLALTKDEPYLFSAVYQAPLIEWCLIILLTSIIGKINMKNVGSLFVRLRNLKSLARNTKIFAQCVLLDCCILLSQNTLPSRDELIALMFDAANTEKFVNSLETLVKTVKLNMTDIPRIGTLHDDISNYWRHEQRTPFSTFVHFITVPAEDVGKYLRSISDVHMLGLELNKLKQLVIGSKLPTIDDVASFAHDDLTRFVGNLYKDRQNIAKIAIVDSSFDHLATLHAQIASLLENIDECKKYLDEVNSLYKLYDQLYNFANDVIFAKVSIYLDKLNEARGDITNFFAPDPDIFKKESAEFDRFKSILLNESRDAKTLLDQIRANSNFNLFASLKGLYDSLNKLNKDIDVNGAEFKGAFDLVTKKLNDIQQLIIYYRKMLESVVGVTVEGISGGANADEQLLTAITQIVKFIVESGRFVSWKNILSNSNEFCKQWLNRIPLSEDQVAQVAIATCVTLGDPNVNTAVKELAIPGSIKLSTPSPQMLSHIKAICAFYSELTRKYQMDDNGEITSNPTHGNQQPYNGRLDSVFVRSAIFIQNVYRITHLALRRSQKNESGDLIVEGIEGADADNIEYYQNEVGNGKILTRMFDKVGNVMKYGVDTLNK